MVACIGPSHIARQSSMEWRGFSQSNVGRVLEIASFRWLVDNVIIIVHRKEAQLLQWRLLEEGIIFEIGNDV